MRTLVIAASLAAFAATVAVCVFGISNLTRVSQPIDDSSSARASASASDTGPQLQAKATDAAAQGPATDARFSARQELLRDNNAAGSWRPRVYSSAKQAEVGGAFYASNMLGFCQGFIETRDLARDEPVQANPQRRAQALRALAERCEDFVDSDFQQQDALRSDPKDPLFEAGRQLQAARAAYFKDPAARPQLLQALGTAISTRDPLLIDSLGQRLIAYREPATGRTAFFFDGVAYPLGQSPDIGLALHLVPCELGLRCDDSEARAQLRCASGACCEGGRLNEVQAMLVGRAEDFERIRLLARAMADAITRGDAAAFAPR